MGSNREAAAEEEEEDDDDDDDDDDNDDDRGPKSASLPSSTPEGEPSKHRMQMSTKQRTPGLPLAPPPAAADAPPLVLLLLPLLKCALLSPASTSDLAPKLDPRISKVPPSRGSSTEATGENERNQTGSRIRDEMR